MQEQHTCKNCGNTFSGKYCNQCGEKVYTAHDKSIPYFFEDALHFVTHFEGTLFTTLKAMATRPGQWSKDFCEGKRKRYFRPLSFFMLLVILYLIFPMYSGLNMPFKFHLSESQLARTLVSKKTKVNIDSLRRIVDSVVDSRQFKNSDQAFSFGLFYADSLMRPYPALRKLEMTYNRKSEKTSKLLLLVMIPLSALFLWLLHFFQKRMFFDHLVLATELNSFNILFSYLLFPLLMQLFYLVLPDPWLNYFTDDSLSLFFNLVMCLYAVRALAQFYVQKWYISLVKGVILTQAIFFLVVKSYRIILFVVTYYLSA